MDETGRRTKPIRITPAMIEAGARELPSVGDGPFSEARSYTIIAALEKVFEAGEMELELPETIPYIP